MDQMNVGELKEALKGVDDDLLVFFRRIAPIAGNIEEAGSCQVGEYAFFGLSLPCVIIEPMIDDGGE